MTPEFPHEIPDDFDPITAIVPSRIPCSMLRLEEPCGNDTNMVWLYAMPNSRYGAIGICDQCAHDLMMTDAQRQWEWRQRRGLIEPKDDQPVSIIRSRVKVSKP